MSSRRQGRGFTSSSAKDYIRDEIDAKIIRQFKDAHCPSQTLSYLGLPGKDLLDIISWREFIGNWTAVQIADSVEDAEIADELERNVFRYHLERGFHFLRGNIDILLSSVEGQNKLHFPYQIVNLDYYGGLINAKISKKGLRKESGRLEAIRSLFHRQAGQPFLLFLTLNLRDDDKDELANFIAPIENDLLEVTRVGVQQCFKSHRDLGHVGELKLYVPIFLANEAKNHSLVIHSPILYTGTIQMIHFAVQCFPYTTTIASRRLGIRDNISLINLPLLVLPAYGKLRQVQLGFIESNF
jgi:hypothetical protein